MCGISAVFEWRGDPTAAFRALATMHQALAHRGPDGEGFLVVDSGLRPTPAPRLPPANVTEEHGLRLALAFRQLRIQDTTGEADQPLSSPDGQLWIVFNGEIYNYRELRRELETKGHQFRTSSDTEVILAAYREWGVDCVRRFDGMWAFLVVDLRRGCLFGSRDRLGIKPLFYSLEAGRLLLASEPAAVARALEEGPRIEPLRFEEFLRGFPPQSTALSFFRGVHPVPPGTLFEIPLSADQLTAIEFREFWRLSDFHVDSQSVPSWEAAREEFMGLFRSSVASQKAASVPVGCLLSGGLDTSMVARVMAKLTAEHGETPSTAYSIVYDDPEMSEWPYIQSVLGQGGLRGCSYTLSPTVAWDSVGAVVQAQGQPLLGQDLIAQYHAYRIAREDGTIVVLQGQGADEMLAGMPSYEAPYLRELLFGLRLRELGAEIDSRARRYRRSRLGILRDDLLAPLVPNLGARRPGYPWLERGVTDTSSFPPEARGLPDESSDPSLLNRHLYHLVRHTNLPAVLLHEDRGSMAHGVESRVPFLNHRLVEFCFRLPAHYKIQRGIRKRILFEAARDWLPDLVLNRTDKKTFVSKRHWMPLRRDHGDALREMASSRTLCEAPGVRPKRIASFVEDYLQGRNNDSLAVWRLYTASRWLAAFGLS